MNMELQEALFVQRPSSRAAVMRVAEARMAVQYLERAEDWAAGLDEDIITQMTLVHRQLLAKIESLCIFRGERGDLPEPSLWTGNQ
jgi:hypothetical protein